MAEQGKDFNTALDSIIADRSTKYGDYNISMRASGLVAQAMIEMHYQIKLPGPVPAHVMSHIMVATKSSRACVPFEFVQDNYDDLHNYARIARDTDPRAPKQGELEF